MGLGGVGSAQGADATSSVSGQLISLPKGGGAVRGVGEKFAPDLHTGTGNLTVPLSVPPGRNGVQPDLSLSYSTGSGNGPFGLGWGLSVPGVARKTSDGLPRYDDERDTFVLSGAEDLVPVEHRSGVTRYRPRTEGLFARIEHRRDATGDYWRVCHPDGLVSHYGTPRPADAPASWVDSAAVADPADPGRVFAWHLTSTVDPFGNRIEYEYERDDGEECTQTYLRRIRYVDHGEDERTEFLISIVLDYEDRPDVLSDRRPTFEVRTRRRCRQVTVHSRAAGPHPVRTQRLRYDNGSANGASLLTGVLIEAGNGQHTESLPPLEFRYSSFEPDGRRLIRVTGAELPSRSLADPQFDLVDLDGNGLPDILQTAEGMRYWRNLGDGRFDRPREMREAPAGVVLSDPGVQLLDANGDGRLELLVNTGGLAGYYPLGPDGQWDRRLFHRHEFAPSVEFDDPDVRLLDLDGDGVTDALRTGSRFECFFNDPDKGWHQTRVVERGRFPAFPDVSFADPRVQLADLSGDGLQDILLVHNGRTEYWPSLGRGNFGALRIMRDSPRFPEGYDPRRVLIGDVDGDGVADLLYVDDDGVSLWINQNGQGFAAPIHIKGTPRVTDLSALRLVDLLGTGVSGLLWSDDLGQTAGAQMYFLDFTGGVKPGLLTGMDNNLGAVTAIGYVPSTRFYLQDRQSSTAWFATLPFPVQVVAEVAVSDQISGGSLTTTYRYHHGYWDGAEREFRGFGRVDQLDAEEFRPIDGEDVHRYSPPIRTTTWFHQGPIGEKHGEWVESDPVTEYWAGDPPALTRPDALADLLAGLPRQERRDALRALRGQVLRTELYELDGSLREDRPVTVTETLTGLRVERRAEAGRRAIFFPHQLATRTTQWERGSDPMTHLSYTDDYDDYGQPCSEISIAVPRGRDVRASAAGEPCLATQTSTRYAHRDDEHRYLIGRVASTTTYELLDPGAGGVLALHAAVVDGRIPRRVVGQALNFFDGQAFQGLPFGRIGDHGVLSRSESLVLTEDILTAVHGEDVPPYLVPSGQPAWTPAYPAEFREHTPALAGYVFRPGGTDVPQVRGYFAVSGRRHDVHDEPSTGRGLLLAERDVLGAETTVAYDEYSLLPVAVTDPAGLTTRARYDYRSFQPSMYTDPNGNRTAFDYTPLGMLERTAVMGKDGENVGDTLEVPGTRLVYDLLAFAERTRPVSVRTIRRVHHVNDSDADPGERDDTIETIEFSDGFGRLLQTRTQAEDVAFGDPVFGDLGLPEAPTTPGDAAGRRRRDGDPVRVVVSGWQRYDNKGRVVEKYEPFFADGFDYSPPAEAQLGQKATITYDARGRAVLTRLPDGSQERVVHGVPDDLADPEAFAPTAWEMFTYDANDNAGRTHADAAADYRDHWNTPSSVLVDALGRTVRTVTRNGADSAEWHAVTSTYDIQGNLLTVTDELGRTAFRHVYDLAGQPLRTAQIDSGFVRTVVDAAGQVLEQRDVRSAVALNAYDGAHRLIRVWASEDGREPTLRQVLDYGDSAAANLLGTLVSHHDEAGLNTVERRDFKGNVLEVVRQVVSDEALLSGMTGDADAWRADWQPGKGVSLAERAAAVLDPTEYRTSTRYDALNRPRSLRYPAAANGERPELRPRYNNAGALEQVLLDGTSFVEHIAYNAKGQRTLLAYGNGVMTRYGYDLRTFRLARLRTERFTRPEPLTFRPSGPPLQDLSYDYDLAGNLRGLLDTTEGSGVPNNPDAARIADPALARLVAAGDALLRTFDYDPRYRLRSATGREHDLPSPAMPWTDRPGGTDVTRTRRYTQRYTYDPAGNLIELRHQATTATPTRTYTPTADTNRLAALTIGQTRFEYGYDAAGNLVTEGETRHLEWDYANRLSAFKVQTAAGEPSVHARYLYDAGGARVRKLVRNQGGQIHSAVYVGGIFEHRRHVHGDTSRENHTLHIMDDQSRIAQVRLGEPDPDDNTPAIKYELGDHLGSSVLTLDDAGAEVNREEYTPYGETSFGSYAKKRYRFTGKERDEESGLYYHGARYYAPWLARWTTCDPAGPVDGLNLYVYVLNNPVAFTDPTGQQHAAPAGPYTPSPPPPPTHGAEKPQQEPSPSSPMPEQQITVQGMASGARKQVVNSIATARDTENMMGDVVVFAVLEAFDRLAGSSMTRRFQELRDTREEGIRGSMEMIQGPSEERGALVVAGLGAVLTGGTIAGIARKPSGSTAAGRTKAIRGGRNRGGVEATVGSSSYAPLAAEAMPGIRTWYANEHRQSMRAARVNGNLLTYDTEVPGWPRGAIHDWRVARNLLGLRPDEKLVVYSGTHGSPRGGFGGALLDPLFLKAEQRMLSRRLNIELRDVSGRSRESILRGARSEPTVLHWCHSSLILMPQLWPGKQLKRPTPLLPK